VRVRRSRRTIKADNDDMQSAESETNGLGASGSIQQFGFDVARKNSPATNNNWRSESPVSKSCRTSTR
jgi:hypothetical protein